MDYGSRGGKYQNKNQTKTYRNSDRFRSHNDEMHSDRDRNDDYYDKKSKKPEQKYYTPTSQQQQQQQQQQQNPGSKHDSSKQRYERCFDNSNRETRQASEPRSNSGYSNHEKNVNLSMITNDHGGRDTRSVEPGGMNPYDHRNKPPSGQPRIPNSALQRLPPNIDSLPPRLKKKFLAEAGLPEEYADQNIMEMTQKSYSNTLPNRGRNNHRYDQPNQNYHQPNYTNHYQSKYNQNFSYPYDHDMNHRSLTPPPPKGRSQQKPPPARYDRKPSNEFQMTESTSPIKKDDEPFSWSEEVMNSQSLPHEVNSTNAHNKAYEDNNRNRRRRRNRSTSSNGSVDRTISYNQQQDNFQFKMPQQMKGNNRNRRNSQSSYNSRENSMERYGYASRENSLDRRQNRRSRYNGRRGSDYQSSRENSAERFGNFPRNESINNVRDGGNSWRREDGHVEEIAELTKQFQNSVELNKNEHRTLFDPSNPLKPIVVTQSQNRPRGGDHYVPDTNEHYTDHQQYLSSTKPVWFTKSSEQYKNIKNKYLIDDLERLGDELMSIIDGDELLRRWDHCQSLREKIQGIFEELLRVDMKFCQLEHIEHYFWKLLFYKTIELLRKHMQECGDDASKAIYKERALETVDNGTRYLEQLVKHLETCHKFQMDQYIGENAASYKSGLGYVGLALVSAQKIFLFLGDLARYREQINQTNNFGRANKFYVKAQQVVPKNGRPFNQLALLAVYSKRKIDAVYFYMRSLMSSNPFLPAKESLVALFDEIRKKYESSQRKREEKNRLRLKEKEHRFDGNLRKETWVHPEGGCRVHRTAPLDPSMVGRNPDSSDDEELRQMEPSELNKRFVVSFLHVQGKLITKIGMESFQTCAVQMLKEFRALLHITPITINSHRLLQLISLNMYAISCTELKDPSLTSLRSEVQECAIAVGLLMFGIILERFIEVVKESLNDIKSDVNVLNIDDKRNSSQDIKSEPKKILSLNEDAKVMLPAIKVWCDWMIYHERIWNPPPFCSDYKIGATSDHDPWNGLANLMTLLETVVNTNKDYLSLIREKDHELVRLQEDITLAGFTPLKNNTLEPIFCRCDIDIEIAQNALRLQKLIFFGKNFLCSCKQPILKKITLSNGKVEYISVVQNRTETTSDSEILLESFSDEEDDVKKYNKKEQPESNGKLKSSPDLKSHHDAAEIRKLLRRKDELERKQRMQEKYNERLQDILSQSTVALHIEVRPRYLIPDTNCFVDDLKSIKAIAAAHPLYQLMIPIVVINELEGLSRGIKPLSSTGIVVAASLQAPVNSSRMGSRSDPQHAAMVAEASKQALAFLKSKNPAVRCVTAKGSIINSAMFTSEDGSSENKSNDDRILDTAMNLCKNNVEEKKGDVRYLVRDVVLLTTDRNLRVKALTNDIPVRELPDFVKWAGLGNA